jgi:heme oxygenase
VALRDAIKENHDKAEAHRFVKLLLSGYMPPHVYADLLLNHLLCYTELEALAKQQGVLDGIEDIQRAVAIAADYEEFDTKGTVFPATRAYIEYIKNVAPTELLAHVYIRHFGDMYGGQMLKKVVPGQASMFDFEDRAGLIAKVRERLSDSLADEANRAFEFNIRLFDEIANAHNIQTT